MKDGPSDTVALGSDPWQESAQRNTPLVIPREEAAALVKVLERHAFGYNETAILARTALGRIKEWLHRTNGL